MDGGFESACITPIHFALQFHRFISGFLNNDRLAEGGEKMERSREINCPSLGFHVILDIRDTSFAGRTHSCI